VPMAPAFGLREAPHGWIRCRKTLDMSGAVTCHPAGLSGPLQRQVCPLLTGAEKLMLLTTPLAPDTPQG
jgi:hypothetical protein